MLRLATSLDCVNVPAYQPAARARWVPLYDRAACVCLFSAVCLTSCVCVRVRERALGECVRALPVSSALFFFRFSPAASCHAPCRTDAQAM